MNLLGAFNWYGFLIGGGMIICIFAAWFLLKKRGYNQDIVINMALITIPCAIIGARLYYVIFDIAGGENTFNYWFMRDGKFTLMPLIGYPSGKLDGLPALEGLAVYGGLIAASLGGLIVRAINKRDKNPRNSMTYVQMLDAFFILIILGQAIGRWGNFANGEAYGNYVGQDSWFPYAVYIKDPKNPGEIPGYYQATFFYESFLNFIAFGLMLWQWLGKRKSYDGFLFSFYCFWYGAARLFIEGLRSDSLYTQGGFNIFIFVSILLAGLGIAAWYVIKCMRQARNKGEKFQPKNLLMFAGVLLFSLFCILYATVSLGIGGRLKISQLVSILLIAWGLSNFIGHIVKAKYSGKKFFLFVDKAKLSSDYCDYEKSINYICSIYEKDGKLKTAAAEKEEKFSYSRAGEGVGGESSDGESKNETEKN